MWSLEWRGTLREIADRVHADIWPLGEETLVLVPRRPVTMHFEGGPVGVVMDLLLTGAGCNSVRSNGVWGKVDVEFRGTPFRNAVAEVCAKQEILVLREGGFIYRASTAEHERRLARRPLPPETLAALGLGRSSPDRHDRVTLKVDLVMASKCLEVIQEAAGVSVEIERDLDQLVTLDLDEILWRDALEVIAWETYGVVWDEGDGRIGIRDIPRCGMHSVTALHIVTEMIARSGGANLEIDPEIQGDSGISIFNAPWRHLLYSLSRKVPFHLRVKPDGTFVAERF